MMKRIQLEPWTAFDKHCLTSAVSRVGDQNWTAVSRATRNIYEDSCKWQAGGEKRSQEWFSNKQCAAQYEHLLKNVPPRRKKRSDRTSEQTSATESPAEILQQNCRQEFIEELKKTIAEEQSQYLKLLKEYEDILAGRLDHRLEEMQEEYEAKEREKEIKIKLKFKLGEKSLSETPSGTESDRQPPPPPPPADPPTTPVKSEKEVSHEPHKTSVTTSPLLTSLLQSPSPLTRPSSVTPTISLILNSSPGVPSNESPTLSKLLETCPTPTTSTSQQLSVASSGSSSIKSFPSASTPQLSRPQVLPSTPLSALIETPSTPAPLRSTTATPASTQATPAVQKVEAPQVLPQSVPVLTKPKEPTPSKEQKTSTVPTIEEVVQSVIAPDTSDQQTLDLPVNTAAEERKKGLPRRLDLENLEPDADNTEFQVIETVEEMIEKVQTAIIETVGDGSGGESSVQDVRDLSTVGGSETTTVDDQSLDMELTSDAVDMIVMGPDRPPCIEVNRDIDSVKDDESKEDNIEEVLDIDEIQPSISASDVAELEEPLKDGISGGKDGLGGKLSPQATSIEQAEADLAAIAREEEEEAASESAEIDEKLLAKEAVVIVRRVEEEELIDKMVDTAIQKVEKSLEEETPDVSVEEVEEQSSLEEEEEKLEPAKEEKVSIVQDIESVSDTKVPEESEEDRSIDESQTKDAASVDEDDSTQDRDSTVSARPIASVEEITTGTENTSDSGGEKVEEEVEQEVQDEPKTSKDAEKETVIPVVQEVIEEPEEKPKLKATDKSTAKEEKSDVAKEDKVEELRTGKRELRRGRNTPPVTSSPVATPVSDRSLREKRPLTPNSSSDGKEEPIPRAGKRKRTTNLSESSVPCSPSPSNVSNDDDKDYRAWKKSILLVYDRIAAHKYASVFLKPINESDAPGYFQIIKCPTDLTTIKRQIESGIIRNTVDFQREMILMISNAIIYNKSDTLVHKMANEMLPDMKEAMETMVQALGSGVLLDQVDSRPPMTSRVSRASVSAKGQTGDDNSTTPSGPGSASAKRKRQLPLEDSRSKRKRSDAS